MPEPIAPGKTAVAPGTATGQPATASLTQVAAGHWRLTGDLGLAQVAALASGPAPSADAGELRLDLAGVRRTSSAAVALLLEWLARLQACGARLTLVDAPKSLYRLAALSNVDGLLGLADRAAAAEATVRPSSPGQD